MAEEEEEEGRQEEEACRDLAEMRKQLGSLGPTRSHSHSLLSLSSYEGRAISHLAFTPPNPSIPTSPWQHDILDCNNPCLSHEPITSNAVKRFISSCFYTRSHHMSVWRKMKKILAASSADQQTNK